jgi:hypothetical protein
MIKKLVEPWATAGSRLIKLWRSIPIFLVLYLSILTAIYLFSATGVATARDLLVSLAVMVLAPILFFVLQSMSVSYVGQDSGAGGLFLRSLKGCWKLIVLALPFIALAWLTIFLIDKAQTAAASGSPVPVPHTVATGAHASSSADSNSVAWLPVALTALELILLWFVLPLAMIHLWISAEAAGLLKAIKGAGRTVLRAFKPNSVLIYGVGLAIFGLVPYFLITIHTPAKSTWLDVGLLTTRLVLAVLFSLFGWVITMGALTERATSK